MPIGGEKNRVTKGSKTVASGHRKADIHGCKPVHPKKHT
ncbi:hypothetical protein QE441_002929 [Chryseobacterium sp. SORGH_AS909]|uniref:Uncharacterized protein n=1 Tax=Chryseobacterium camelliae TaxID=1265445 RepID=A0ABU0TFR0_9FLAO|nr:hypothetical protein [Chryseobacterium camelliae]MDQ1099788.1 hypothetical protein [Chryseobacterium sp. SORGH_AS_1048]MDR6087135.1 hypothetical protein [Chryseobacterium sp. SORGH_AS_0909]MDR6131508.1 hypothetical protein [Chryseobacterium sp. SORGH_AS_1175]MDT3406349.1 hypothetical protein [Pseudacidovorax intermedius]